MVNESIFTLANAIGLFGWSFTLLVLLSQSTAILSDYTDAFYDLRSGRIPLLDQLFLLEVICFTEVGRIAIGQLRGNLVLGLVLHSIRMACMLLVLPEGLAGEYDARGVNNPKFLSTVILYSWSLTEVGRYPMYLFPESKLARKIRMILPLFTFPAGAAAEALGAYGAIEKMMRTGKEEGGALSSNPVHYYAVLGSLSLVVFVNGVLGPTMAYPALLKKGLPVLTGRTDQRERRRTKAE